MHQRVMILTSIALIHHAELSKSTTAKGLRIINSDLVTVGQRQKLYRQGGIFSITSRILISDLLAENMLPPENITGIVLLHAERYGGNPNTGEAC